MTFEEDFNTNFPSLSKTNIYTFMTRFEASLAERPPIYLYSSYMDSKTTTIAIPIQLIQQCCLDKQKVRDAIIKVAEEYDIKFVDKLLKELDL
jgi:hypothetical protein